MSSCLFFSLKAVLNNFFTFTGIKNSLYAIFSYIKKPFKKVMNS